VAYCGMMIQVGVYEQTQGILPELDAVTSVSPHLAEAFSITDVSQKITVATEIVYLFDQLCIKLAMATFFLRIVHEKWQLWTVKISVAVYGVYAFAFAILCMFQCGTPVPEHFIDPSGCMSWENVLGPMNHLGATSNCVIDWILTAIPCYTVYKVQMSRRDKASICALILLGLVASIVSVVRIPLVNGVRVTGSLDVYHNFVPIACTSIIESGLGIMAMGFAALRPLYTHAKSKTRSHQAGKRAVPPHDRQLIRASGSRGLVEQVEDPEKAFGGLHIVRSITTIVDIEDGWGMPERRWKS